MKQNRGFVTVSRKGSGDLVMENGTWEEFNRDFLIKCTVKEAARCIRMLLRNGQAYILPYAYAEELAVLVDWRVFQHAIVNVLDRYPGDIDQEVDEFNANPNPPAAA